MEKKRNKQCGAELYQGGQWGGTCRKRKMSLHQANYE